MDKTRSDLIIQIDAKSAVPAYEQIKRAVKLAILSGRLKEGERLATLREMALKLMVNPNTIIKVYEQLENEGFIYSRPGAGYFVRLDRAKSGAAKEKLFREITLDYIAKAVDLGFASEEMLRELARLTDAGVPGVARRDGFHD